MPIPIPIILAIAATAAAGSGLVAGAKGVKNIINSKKIAEQAKERHEENERTLKHYNTKCCKIMDLLGTNEIKILADLSEFIELFEKIKNRPLLKNLYIEQFNAPKFSCDEIKDISFGAAAMVGGLSGAALGAASGIAASGATTAAVMALGTASTGTAISTLSGAALTNATLAALGGGSLAAGGGGIALGTTILGASTLGVGLLVGGIVFNIVGSKIQEQSQDIVREVDKMEHSINKVVDYLKKLARIAKRYNSTLVALSDCYYSQIDLMRDLVSYKTNWRDYTADEKLIVENTVLLVGAIYAMCKVQLVVNSEEETELNIKVINKKEASKARKRGKELLEQLA